MSLTYGGLCEGYGGLTMGVQSVLGGELAWYSEFDKAPSAILAHHHPGVPNLGDLTKIDWTKVKAVDILTAGFPCQPFSHAGKRLGANDPRHLWPYIQEAVRILRPRLCLFENVRGLLSGQGEPDTDDIALLADRVARIDRIIKARKARNAPTDNPVAVRLMGLRKRAVGALRRARKRLVRAIGAVVGGLADVGYDAWWIGFRAADVGAAHGRFRVFVFATPADADHSGWGEHGRRVAVRAEQPAAERAGDSALTLLPTPAVNDMGAAYTPETWDAWTDRMKAEHGNGNGHGKSLSIEALRLLPSPRTSDTNGAGSHGTGGPDLRTVTSLLPTPRATDGTKGGPNQRGSSGDLMLPSAVHALLPTPRATRGGSSSETRDRLLPTPTSMDSKASGGGYNGQTNVTLTDATVRQQQDWREYEAAIRRQEQAFGRPAPLPTEPGAKGQPRLSPRFVEWLMAVPEGHVTDPAIGISRNDQLKALGNGVVPPQAAAATRAWLADRARQENVA